MIRNLVQFTKIKNKIKKRIQYKIKSCNKVNKKFLKFHSAAMNSITKNNQNNALKMYVDHWLIMSFLPYYTTHP